ncbi:putative lipoprotein [Mycobacterium kansasii]|uniref:Putative lipoprotein n=1 Tax=Mycobacterium kansasii TaxID=1768 RepID=A0A1V3WTH8_MYCKA|nr:putative lipoprotein [Mycobacterium kansasii]
MRGWSMPVDRRGFLTWSGLGMLTATGLVSACSNHPPAGKADYTLRIGHSQVEVAPANTSRPPPTTANSPGRC